MGCCRGRTNDHEHLHFLRDSVQLVCLRLGYIWTELYVGVCEQCAWYFLLPEKVFESLRSSAEDVREIKENNMDSEFALRATMSGPVPCLGLVQAKGVATRA